MSIWRRLALAITIMALFGILLILFNRTQAGSIKEQEHIILSLREIREFDSEWNINILRLSTGLHLDYDLVTTPLRTMRPSLVELEKASNNASTNAPQLALAKLKRALAEKEAQVEKFKSQHAILRNSLIYFPQGTETFKSLISTTAVTQAPLQAQLLYALDVQINGLMADTLHFNLNPQRQLAEQINVTLLQLDDNKANYGEVIAPALGQLVMHARAIVRQRVVEDGLLQQIASAPTALHLNELADAFNREFDAIAQQKQRDRVYLLSYSSFLLLLLTVLGWRLIKSYQVVAQVNRRLRSANELLEQRVAERTAELEAQSARLAALAIHDGLTGLINCSQLMHLLNRALLHAERRGSIVVVMFIDLDGFKAVNDTYGHAAGDMVLKEVARRVPGHLRQEDSLARLGGDEFVILLEDASTREGAVRVAQEALRQIESITEVGGNVVRISASIGISSAQGKIGATHSADTLLDEADHAMYQAKQAGKGCIRFNKNAKFRNIIELIPPKRQVSQ